MASKTNAVGGYFASECRFTTHTQEFIEVHLLFSLVKLTDVWLLQVVTDNANVN
jgi:hypothetical protein